jgi:hypothetical protein
MTPNEKGIELAYAHWEGESCQSPDADKLAEEIAKAILEERERCAKIAETTFYCDGMERDCGAAQQIAKRIREGKE